MSNVIRFPDLRDIPLCLRNMADEIEDKNGNFKPKSLTICSEDNCYHLGTKDDKQAMKDGVFNITIALHTLMSYCMDKEEL